MKSVFILAAVRTAIGRYGGSLRDFSTADLVVVVAQSVLSRAAIEAGEVDEVIFAHARQAGSGPNPARQIAVRAGGPVERPAFTVNQACASGLKAIILGYQQLAVGNAEIVLVVGTESMSRVSCFVEGARWGARIGHQTLTDGMFQEGYFCPLAKMVMGETAEVLAGEYKISRDEQDAFALIRQERARRGLSTLCVSGGPGVALDLEAA